MLVAEIWAVAVFLQIAAFASLVAVGNANPNRELGSIKSARPLAALLFIGFLVSIGAGFNMCLTLMTVL